MGKERTAQQRADLLASMNQASRAFAETMRSTAEERKRFAKERERLLERERAARAEAEASRERLRESEARLRLALDIGQLSSFEWEPETGVLRWDANLEALWGLPANAGGDYDVFLSGLHPEDRERVEARLAGAIDPLGDGLFEAEFRVVGVEDGVERWVAARGQTFFDGDRSTRFAGVAQDVTRRKRVEEALRESETRFRAAFEQARVGIVQASLDGRVLVPNPGFCQIIGYTEEEARELHVRDVTHPDDYEADMEQGRRVLRGDIPGYSMEKRYIRKDGSVIWVNLTSTVARGDGGEPLYALAIVEDIDERKRAERELREVHSQLETAVAAGSVAIVTWDIANDVIVGNERLAEIFGIEPEETRSLPIAEYLSAVHEEDLPRLERLIQHALETSEPYEIEYRVTGRDGKVRWVHSRGKPERDAAGNTVRLPAALIDITGRKRAEEALALSAARDAFRVALADALRPLDDPIEIQAAAMRVLGEHLRVDRVLYAEIEPDDASVVIADNYANGVPKIVGRLPLSDFEQSSGKLRAGQPLVVSDVATSADLAESDRRSLTALGIVSTIGVPLVKGGRWVANLGVHHGAPRMWSEDDTTFLRETAERTWAAVERARAEEALRESEARFRRVFSNNMEAMAIWSPSGAITEANDAMLELVGYTREELETASLDWRELTPPEYRERDERAIAEVEARGVCPPYEKEFIHKDGRRVPVLIGGGRFDERAGTGILFALDLTERKRAEEALRESEERLRTVVEGTPVILFALDREGKITFSAGRGLESLGSKPGELVGISAFDFHATRPEIQEHVRRALAGEAVVADFHMGGPIFETLLNPVRDIGGKVTGVIGVATDVTERKKTREDRERSLLRERAARAQAEERRRISRDLHDRVAHSIGVVHQSLELHEALKERNPEAARTRIELARKTVREALDSTRNLSAELRRPEVRRGLEAALADLLRDIVPPEVDSSLSIEGDESHIPPGARDQVFLILREAVRNAVKHSGCENLSIDLETTPEKVVGRVEDDGRGFDLEGEIPRSSNGLGSMRERASLVSGALEVSSAPDEGTKISVSVPLRDPEKD